MYFMLYELQFFGIDLTSVYSIGKIDISMKFL